MRTIDVVVAVLLVVGGLNWGLVGLFRFDAVAAVFGGASAASRLVYAIVGFCAAYQAAQWKAIQRRWEMTPGVTHEPSV